MARATRVAVAAVAAAVVLLAVAVYAQEAPAATTDSSSGSSGGVATVQENSFRYPFNKFDAQGNRMVPNWLAGGHADVSENFIRLTTDRQSKRGWLWNRPPVTTDHWTVTMYFRVSGQAQNLFGDGFAFWATQHPRYVEGSVHGFTDTYNGFGLVFDTFRNTEAGHYHKDIALYASDGTKAVDTTAGVEPIGCDADFRYHEGRDDFSVNARSAAKITYNKGKLSVSIDPRGKGEWRKCIENADLPMAADWNKKVYFGITATTGQLADNHDMLAFLTALGDESAPEKEEEQIVLDEQTLAAVSEPIRLYVKAQLKEIADKLQHLHHHVEHQLSAVNDGIKNTVGKLKEAEQENLRRIEALEARLRESVNTQVTSSITSKLSGISEELTNKVNDRLIDQIAPKISSTVKNEVSASSGGWFWPFLLLFLLFVGAAVFAYTKYRHLQKTHLL